MIGEIFDRASYHFEARVGMIEDQHQPGICNTSKLLTREQICLHHGCRPIQRISMGKINKHGYQNTAQIHVIEVSNLGHSYQKYTVYLCQRDANLSTNMNIQMWIHARTRTNIPFQPGEINECLTTTQCLRLVFHKVRLYPCDYNDLKSNMVETT